MLKMLHGRVFHGPQWTEHNFAELFTIAQSGQAAVERLPMQQGDTNCRHIHKCVSCSLAKLCQKHEHQSQNILGVDGGSWILALSCFCRLSLKNAKLDLLRRFSAGIFVSNGLSKPWLQNYTFQISVHRRSAISLLFWNSSSCMSRGFFVSAPT